MICYGYCDVSEFMAQRALATVLRLAINPTGDFEEKRVRLTPGRGKHYRPPLSKKDRRTDQPISPPVCGSVKWLDQAA
jgi:hypothetical protein